jgi:hypothetical protein
MPALPVEKSCFRASESVIIVLVFEREKFAMRKHIYGFALFVFIIASGAGSYALFFSPPDKDPPIVKQPVRVTALENRGAEKAVDLSPVSYKIRSFIIDLEKKEVIVEVDLRWNSELPEPSAIRLNFGVATAASTFEGIEIGSAVFDDPFIASRMVSRTFTVTLTGREKLDPKERNYYGYLEVGDNGPPSGATTLVYRRKNKLAGSVPALVRHLNKK